MMDEDRPVYVLALNPMTGNTENRTILAWSYSKEELQRFVDGEKVESYTEPGPDMFNGGQKNYRKCYRKGGPLEMYNDANDPIYCGRDNTEGGIVKQASFNAIRQQASESAKNNYLNWLNQGRFIPG